MLFTVAALFLLTEVQKVTKSIQQLRGKRQNFKKSQPFPYAGHATVVTIGVLY